MEKLTGCSEASFHSHLGANVMQRSLYSDISPLFCTLWSHIYFSLSVFQFIEVDLFLVLVFSIVIMEKFKHHSNEEYCKSVCTYHSLSVMSS